MFKLDLRFVWSIALEACCVLVAHVEGCTFLRCFTPPVLQSNWFPKRTISQRCPTNFMFCTVNSEAQCLVLNILFNGQEGNKANKEGDTTVLGRDKKTLTPIDLSMPVSHAQGWQMSRGPNVNLPAEHAVNFLSLRTTTKGKESCDGKGKGKDLWNQKEGRDVQLLRAGAGSTGRGCGSRAASPCHEHSTNTPRRGKTLLPCNTSCAFKKLQESWAPGQSHYCLYGQKEAEGAIYISTSFTGREKAKTWWLRPAGRQGMSQGLRQVHRGWWRVGDQDGQSEGGRTNLSQIFF